MENPPGLELTLGNKTHQVRVLNLLQQRAIGSALFKAPAIDSADPTKFDFDTEFDSAACIVFAAISREDPTGSRGKWLSELDASFHDLQLAKAAVLRFAGYIKDHPATAATAMPDPSPV